MVASNRASMDQLHRDGRGGSRGALGAWAVQDVDEQDAVLAVTVVVGMGGDAVDRRRPRSVIEPEPDVPVEIDRDAIVRPT